MGPSQAAAKARAKGLGREGNFSVNFEGIAAYSKTGASIES